MSVPTFYTRVVRAKQTRNGGLVSKDDGALALTKAIDTDIEFAELYQVDAKSGTILSPTGADSKSKKTKNVAETTNEAYTASAGRPRPDDGRVREAVRGESGDVNPLSSRKPARDA